MKQIIIVIILSVGCVHSQFGILNNPIADSISSVRDTISNPKSKLSSIGEVISKPITSVGDPIGTIKPLFQAVETTLADQLKPISKAVSGLEDAISSTLNSSLGEINEKLSTLDDVRAMIPVVSEFGNFFKKIINSSIVATVSRVDFESVYSKGYMVYVCVLAWTGTVLFLTLLNTTLLLFTKKTC
ncbi:hypothetical protein AV955_gp053 [Diadromus pulchellus ascovirus 4a]|uniref:Complete DpAV4 genome n=1 Tax=Diadromus pulchellus ascovirus 4a TaxID=158683 RepID=F2NYY2_9VIRU|nr:hypothetical protein AV955_gp053 [Diadromus pulchellus ascovirus 4a]CCA61410.1 unnamed protein product [Diadromus pulchellus ascovirus 4a]